MYVCNLHLSSSHISQINIYNMMHSPFLFLSHFFLPYYKQQKQQKMPQFSSEDPIFMYYVVLGRIFTYIIPIKFVLLRVKIFDPLLRIQKNNHPPPTKNN